MGMNFTEGFLIILGLPPPLSAPWCLRPSSRLAHGPACFLAAVTVLLQLHGSSRVPMSSRVPARNPEPAIRGTDSHQQRRQETPFILDSASARPPRGSVPPNTTVTVPNENTAQERCQTETVGCSDVAAQRTPARSLTPLPNKSGDRRSWRPPDCDLLFARFSMHRS